MNGQIQTDNGDVMSKEIIQRVLEALCSSREGVHIDGPPEFQRGFMEGFRYAEAIVKAEAGFNR